MNFFSVSPIAIHFRFVSISLLLVSIAILTNDSVAAQGIEAIGNGLSSVQFEHPKSEPSKELRLKLGTTTNTPNPYLSFLPAGSQPDYEFWRSKMNVDTDSNGIEEALVLMIRDSDGRILVQGRNTAGNPAPIQYWFSP